MVAPTRYDLANHMKKLSIDSQAARQTLETQRITTEEPGRYFLAPSPRTLPEPETE